MSVSLIEQETTVSFNRTEETAEIWTSDTTMMSKLDRLCKESPEHWKCKKTEYLRDGSLANKVYVVDSKRLISFRSRTVKRELTEEQREEYRERALRMRNKGYSPNKTIATENLQDDLEEVPTE